MFRNLILVAVCLAVTLQVSQAKCTADEEAACKLPDCLCPSVEVPGGLEATNIPQVYRYRPKIKRQPRVN